VREIKPVLEADPHDPRKKRIVMPEEFKKEIILPARSALSGGEIDIPGDFSTAAFFFGLAAISGSSVTVRSVGLNPTRTAFLNYLKSIGCGVDITNKTVISAEPRGDVTVTGGELKPRRLAGEDAVRMIDEIPIASVVAAFAPGTTVIRDVRELRVKESDRITAIADNLGRCGIQCGVLEDGLAIEGGNSPSGADFASFGDHRIAMAFAVASAVLEGPSSIDDESCVAISCPSFFDLLQSVAK
jgi:3-phosphoshikimate 1-carboxyvinyltransferase